MREPASSTCQLFAAGRCTGATGRANKGNKRFSQDTHSLLFLHRPLHAEQQAAAVMQEQQT